MITQLLRLSRTYAPQLTRRFRVLLAISIIVQAAATLSLIPLIVAWETQNTHGMLTALGALTVFVAASWVTDRAQQKVSLKIGFILLDSIQRRLARILPTVPTSWLTHERRSSAIHILSSVGPELVASIGYVLSPAITGFTLPLLLGVGLVVLGPIMGFSMWIGTAGLVAYLAVVGAWIGSIHMSERAEDASEAANTAVTERLIEFAGQQRTLRANRQAASSQSAVAQALRGQRSATMRLIAFQIPGTLLFGIAMQIALVALAATTIWQWNVGELSGSLAVALIVVSVRFLEPIGMLADISQGIHYGRTLVREINELIAMEKSVPPVDMRDLPPRVELHDVTFAYANRPVDTVGDSSTSQSAESGAEVTRVLESFSMTLEPGTTTALIGPSGSGKSTVLSLIAGLERPSSGTVLIDGETARPGMASVVFQFPYLFDASIRDNIEAARSSMLADAPDGASTGETDDGAVATAIERARVDDVARGLPRGLDTRVGEGGKNLSGGERQRVSIARALAHPSRLLLIDEATSALDHENEAAIAEALSLPGYTRLIIAHRPAAVAHADRVIVLDGGEIVADGSPDDVARESEYYRGFLRDSAEAEQWQLT